MKADLYHKTTGQFVEDVVPPPETDATIGQLETDWKHHPFTAKFHRELSEEIDALITSAMSLATCYHTHNNHQQIIEKLVRAAELRKLKVKYA